MMEHLADLSVVTELAKLAGLLAAASVEGVAGAAAVEWWKRRREQPAIKLLRAGVHACVMATIRKLGVAIDETDRVRVRARFGESGVAVDRLIGLLARDPASLPRWFGEFVTPAFPLETAWADPESLAREFAAVLQEATAGSVDLQRDQRLALATFIAMVDLRHDMWSVASRMPTDTVPLGLTERRASAGQDALEVTRQWRVFLAALLQQALAMPEWTRLPGSAPGSRNVVHQPVKVRRPWSHTERDEFEVSDEVLRRHKRVWIVGNPGYGKSWILDRLTAELAADAMYRLVTASTDDFPPGTGGVLADGVPSPAAQAVGIVPVPLRLPVLADAMSGFVDLHDRGRSVMNRDVFSKVIVDELATSQDLWHHRGCRLDPDWWSVQLLPMIDAGRVHLLLDGWDEVAKDRSLVAKTIQQYLAQSDQHQRPGCTVTCRSAQFPDHGDHLTTMQLWFRPAQTERDDGVVVELQRFDSDQRNAFISAWFAPEPPPDPLVDLDDSLAELFRVPLLAAFACFAYQDQPHKIRTQADLYQRVVTRLISGTHRQFDNLRPLDADFVRSYLPKVAYYLAVMADSHRRKWDNYEFDDLTGALAAVGQSDRSVREQLELLIGRYSLFQRTDHTNPSSERDEGRVYTWHHPTIGEYLAGVHLARNPDEQQRQLVQRIYFDDNWIQMLGFALGSIKNQEGTGKLIKLVYEGAQAPFRYRTWSAAALTKYGDPSLLTKLPVLDRIAEEASALADVRGPFYEDAATALAELAHVSHLARKALWAVLVDADADYDVRRTSVDALAGVVDDPDVRAALLGVLANSDADLYVRRTSVDALAGVIDDPDVRAALLGVLANSDADLYVRETSVDALAGVVDDPDVRAALLGVLADPAADPDVRRTSVRALAGVVDDSDVRAALLGVLADPAADLYLRRTSVRTLAGVVDDPDVRKTPPADPASDPDVRRTSVDALAGVVDDSDVRAALLGVIADSGADLYVRETTVRALAGVVDDPDVRAALLGVLADPAADPDVRRTSVDALAGVVDDPDVRAALLGVLADSGADLYLRRTTVRALAGVVDDPDVRAALLGVLVDPGADPDVRRTSVRALAGAIDSAAGPRPETLLAEARRYCSSDDRDVFTREMLLLLQIIAKALHQPEACEQWTWLLHVADAVDTQIGN